MTNTQLSCCGLTKKNTSVLTVTKKYILLWEKASQATPLTNPIEDYQ
jgi:hypothetical protein